MNARISLIAALVAAHCSVLMATENVKPPSTPLPPATTAPKPAPTLQQSKALAAVTPRLTVKDVTGTFNSNVRIAATLTDADGKPIQNVTVNFKIGSEEAGTAMTDYSGVAGIFILLKNQAVGANKITVHAQSADGLINATATANLEALRPHPMLTLEAAFPGGGNTVQEEQEVILSGSLTTDSNGGTANVSDKTIDIYLDGNLLYSVAMNGAKYSKRWKVPVGNAISGTFTAKFSGDERYFGAAAPNAIKFTIMHKPKLPANNLINTPEIRATGVF